MAAVTPPEITYRSALPQSLLTEGRLSDIQYESVLYAGQRHAQILPGGARAGYFVGDGTGVGKGRIVAAIILDNWQQGRQRAAWFSVSNDLMEAAIRDLRDIGAQDIPIVRVNEFPTGGRIEQETGVVFATYQSLIATSRSDGTAGRSRREQIQEWLGADGLIVYDEAHKAKNALAQERGEPTQTGLAVVALQENLPAARVVYVSATGATDVRHMAYMTRLGLWGPSTAFPGGFNEFLSEIDAGGVGAMEMVARDLKALGMYNSRSISFRGVDYREVIHELTPAQREMYNVAAEAWQLVLGNMQAALNLTNANAMARRNAMTRFWGDQQRFFRNLITAMKIPSCIRETEAALAEGKSVVIGLIGTGESKTAAKVAQAVAHGTDLDSLDFTPREVICDLVRRAFPVDMYREVTDKATGQTIREKVTDAEGNPVRSKKAIAMREALLERVSSISLPENPLDQLVNHFGPDLVAELTGRKRRLIRDPKTGETSYVKRVPEGVAMNRVNLYEMERFQEGPKRVAIISDAASTGISLHASNRGGNQQRRVHITLELGWSADKQMQMFGRTHRSDQSCPPEYRLLSTNVGGERRFSSTIARRLASLGALTKGQRDASGGGQLAQHNFESREGQAALQAFYSHIVHGGSVPGLESPMIALADMGLLRDGSIAEPDMRDVPHFLNRILALDIDRQNAMFNEFVVTFDRTVENARAAGTFDAGVEDIRGLAIRLGKEPELVHREATTGAETHHFELHVDEKTNPVRWEDVYAEYGQAGDCPLTGFYTQTRSERLVFAKPWVNRTDVTGKVIPTVLLQTPKSRRHEVVEKPAFTEKFQPTKVVDAKPLWEAQVAAIPPVETRQVHVIGGAILPLWARLKTSEAQQLQVVRATVEDGRRVVGIQVPEAHVARTLHAIGVTRSLKTPEEVYRAVGREGESVMLTAGLWIKPTKVHNEPRIEVTGLDHYKFELARSMGMVEEWIDWKKRFFVPLDEAKGLEVLGRFLEQYPVISTETKDPVAEHAFRRAAADESPRYAAVPEKLAAAVPMGMRGDEAGVRRGR